VNDTYEPYSAPPTPRPAPIVEENLTNPTVTYVLIAVTSLVYILQFGTQAFLGTDIPALLGMKINEYIMAGQLWRLVTPMFLHGSIMHIAFNMYALALWALALPALVYPGRFCRECIFIFAFSQPISRRFNCHLWPARRADGFSLPESSNFWRGCAPRPPKRTHHSGHQPVDWTLARHR
jgi:hypothetical protein